MKVLLMCIWITSSFVAKAFQDSLKLKGLVFMGTGIQSGIGVFKQQYGLHQSIQGGLKWNITSSLETGPEIHYYFGPHVLDDVLIDLRSPDGSLIGGDHQLAPVDLRMRALSMNWTVAYGLKLTKNKAVVIGLHPGWMSHWIRFQNASTFEPLQGHKRYGYDRLTSGLGLMETVRFRYLASNKLINFEFAGGLGQFNTLLRRNVQFDSHYVDRGRYWTKMAFISFHWILPIYNKSNPNTIYY